ncbi:hypothetical protein BDN70DRAFT_874430 [Pholiota conissans]|uniref:DUF6534 domain-containing protein n=1 Tax=Pholiota conissans TaxID=109636 RepID=A0A9P5Z8N4_9AGAR|nr:hypothetical protein BDN70DRAFT_874430 [Pholiota conissans]
MSMDMPPAAMAQDNVSALFLGFLMGAILFGAALLQTYQYFMTYTRDSKRRKFMIAAVLILDTLHLVFSGIMMYLTISRPLRFTDDSLLWALKGFATIKALLIVLVQSYYLSIIWQFASSLTLNIVVSKVIRSICVMLFIYAIGMAIVFLTYLEQDSRFFNFSPSFQTIVYVAFSSTAVIDSTIAGVLSYLLVKASPGGRARTRNVITFLVLFFVGTGLLTAIMAITTIAVYATRPSTVLYLAIEFAVPRLYANSILAMFNSKARLRKRMEVTTELKLSSMLLFDDLPSGSDSDSPPSPEPPEAEKP